MDLISSKAELAANIDTLRGYLSSNGVDKEFAVELIRSGTCFVVTTRGAAILFAPSRFVGYAQNSRHDHGTNEDKDGRETNAALERLLRKPPLHNAVLEQQYDQFCLSLGASLRKAPFGVTRKFWDLRGCLTSG